MVLYENEQRAVEEAEECLRGLSTESWRESDLLKKKRELFHFYTFLSLDRAAAHCERIELLLPEDGEGADIVMMKPEKRVIEITECLDEDGDKHKEFREAVDSLFGVGENNYGGKNLVEGLVSAFDEVTGKKIEKIQTYKKDGFSTELLIVTDVAYENCPITGTWVEKFLPEEFVDRVSGVFDRIHLLIYHASGKDGGPVVREIPKDFEEYRKIVDRG